MGTDIHAFFQAKKNGNWEFVDSEYEQDRHYQLFSHLAGVRNGTGFAGVRTGDPVTPISEPRGIPSDFVLGNNGEWLGDHSYSWLTAEENLSHDFGNNRRDGIVSMHVYVGWDGVSPPSSYCGGVYGNGIVVADSPVDIDDSTTHVRVEWIESDDVFDYFLDEVRRLKDAHDEVRMVLGFDS